MQLGRTGRHGRTASTAGRATVAAALAAVLLLAGGCGERPGTPQRGAVARGPYRPTWARPTWPAGKRAARELPPCVIVGKVGTPALPPHLAPSCSRGPFPGPADCVVILELTVDAEGTVSDPRILRSCYDAATDRKALEIVSSWRYDRPAVWIGDPRVDREKGCSLLPGDPIGVLQTEVVKFYAGSAVVPSPMPAR